VRDRIMIVGRDVGLRAQLARLLKTGGYRVEIAESAAHACRIGFAGIGLAVVAADGRGPEEKGPMQELRAAVGSVLLVAAPGGKRDSQADLLDVTDETGLLARVAEALAPAPESDTVEPMLEFAGYRLDPGGHSLLDPTGKEVSLTHGEFGLLRVLAQRAGRVLSREQLLRLLAGRDAEAYDRSIDMHIVRLRRKIEPDPKHPALIVTIPNSGYKFAAKVHQAEALIPEPEVAAAPTVAALALPERRYVTALAAELLPADGKSLPGDPEELRAVVDTYRRYATAVIARHGGVMAESRVREVLAYFGYPVAQEHAAERAIHAALALADRLIEGEASLPAGLTVRVGVASGSVVAGPADEVMGEAPAEAVALLTPTEPGAVVVDEATRQLTGALFEWVDLGTVPLKGALHPVHAWRALRQSAVESRFEALRAPQLAPMVGREEELELLLRRWGQARSGQGRLALVAGEPGIGKSRLLAALEQRLVAERLVRLRYFCSPHHQDTPLYPIVRQLQFAAGFAGDDTPVDRLVKLQAVLAPTDPPAEDVALIAALFQLPLDGLPVLNLSPQRRKERTFAALLHQVERLSQQRPLLMLFEDLHWADPSTREILENLVQRLPNLPVLVVMTFRPEFHAPWIGQPGVTLITLSRLDHREATSLAKQLTIGLTLSPALIERVVAQSDGVPLFIEELTKATIESIAQIASEPSDVAVPTTLQGLLLSRLDRMPAAKQIAQIGAVIGRDFSHAMISAVADLPAEVLNEDLDQLVASGLVFRRGERPEAAYTFKHALVQDAAYDSLLRARRVALHAVIGDALERDAEVVATRPALLGHHFAHAGAVERAVAYFLRAGQQSAAASAMAEAQAHLRRGLALAAKIADASDRNLRQAELTLALGNVQMAVHGYASTENGAAFTEAVRLCHELHPKQANATKLLARALFGNFAYLLHAGQLAASYATARELLTLGRNHPDPEIRAVSATAYGVSCFCLARLQEVAETFATAVADRGLDVHAATLAEFGIDGRSFLHALFARHLALQGLPEQADEQARTGMERAQRLQHLPTIAITLSSLCTTAWILRDRSALEVWSSELVRHASEQGFAFWLARGQGYAGWTAAANGRLEGHALLAEGLAGLERAGALLYGPHTRAMFADVHAQVGQYDLALAVLEEAFEIGSRTGEVWVDAELYRRKGELLRTDHATAETYFQRAVEIARAQSAKLFELRAAVSLARLWREHGRPDDAREMLAPIYAWFTEGFDTPDLTEAQALLDELATASV